MKFLTKIILVAASLIPFVTPATAQEPDGRAYWSSTLFPVHAELADPVGKNPMPEPEQPQRATQWKWRKANGWEFAGIGAAAALSLYLEYDEGDPKSPRWSARNDFDEAIRNALRLGGKSDRRAASHASDAVMGLMIAAPTVDSFVFLGYRDRDWDAFYHTNIINLESFTFTSFVSVVLQTQLARERPFVRNCQNGECESDQIYRSMPSGHTAYAFTGAGLLCTHHAYQHNYGDPDIERTVCATALGVATAEGFLRIMADGHYATDVLAGAGVGLFSGFLLPRLLHYWHPAPVEPPQQTSRKPRRHFMVAPTLMRGDGGGLTWTYYF